MVNKGAATWGQLYLLIALRIPRMQLVAFLGLLSLLRGHPQGLKPLSSLLGFLLLSPVLEVTQTGSAAVRAQPPLQSYLALPCPAPITPPRTLSCALESSGTACVCPCLVATLQVRAP